MSVSPICGENAGGYQNRPSWYALSSPLASRHESRHEWGSSLKNSLGRRVSYKLGDETPHLSSIAGQALEITGLLRSEHALSLTLI